MSIDRPATAPPRDDLPFLRRRRRPAATAPLVKGDSAVTDFIMGRSSRYGRASVTPTAQPPEQAPSTTATQSMTHIGPGTATSTDTRSASTGIRKPPRTRFGSVQPRSTNPVAATILTTRSPTVMLNRLQSGIGALTFDAAWSTTEYIRLGCAFQMHTRQSGLVRPSGVTGPLLLESRGPQQRLILDLLSARYLDRLIVFAAPPSGAAWGMSGTLIVTTYGQGRIEIPLDRPTAVGVAILLSLYNIDGEFVLRSESNDIAGSTRDACIAFGFDRIPWLDANNTAI